jgi:hypothetical protein
MTTITTKITWVKRNSRIQVPVLVGDELGPGWGPTGAFCCPEFDAMREDAGTCFMENPNLAPPRNIGAFLFFAGFQAV